MTNQGVAAMSPAPAIYAVRLFIRARSWYLPDGTGGMNPRSLTPFDTIDVDLDVIGPPR
jgi:hypothetical protein